LAVGTAGVPLLVSGGGSARFLIATAALTVLVLLLLRLLRRAEETAFGMVSAGACVAAALLGWQAWQAGAVGLARGTESVWPWASWLLSWPGTGLVSALAITGLRVVGNAQESPLRGGVVWPFALTLAGVAVLLGVEGRARILEASIVLGLLFGGAVGASPLLRRRRSTWFGVAAGALLVLWSFAVRDSHGAGSYVHPAGLSIEDRLDYEVIDSDLELPSALAHSPDGRVFVADFAADAIWVYREAGGGWERRLFARWPRPESRESDVRSSEAGLWGLAFHPEGGWLYAMGIQRWASDAGPDGRSRGVSRVLRFADSPGGEPIWEEVLGDLPAGSLHSGGGLVFGPDGSLFVSVGEGGYGGPGRQAFVGTILRLSVDSTDAPMIYARGLRNPYGLAFGPGGQLFATENGPDCCDRLLRVQQGDDFGWRPGPATPDDSAGVSSELTLPLWDSGPSRIGPTGLVAGPASLHFVTWHTAALHAVTLNSAGEVSDHRIRFEGGTARPPDASVYRFVGGFTGLSSGPDGRLWFTSVGTLGRFAQ